ncbi:MAG: hypothetical protein RM049_33340 [Nostoc sp. DedQUE04]|nr:hypothetical protein [Nostoc sp. DedQUE04]MDZ8140122.1 hypothetical protein [Nostoc sp. DedQUE04]
MLVGGGDLHADCEKELLLTSLQDSPNL